MAPTDPSAEQPQRFYAGQPVAMEEDLTTEFKEVTSKQPANTIIDTVEDYAVAFLNSEGGRIFWGIRDADRCVVGVSLDAGDRDQIRKGIAGKFHLIQPPVDPSCYRLDFHTIDGAPEAQSLCVVEVAVVRVSAREPFYNHRGEAFIRVEGVKQKMVGPRLTAWILKRAQKDALPHGSVDDPKIRGLIQRIRRIFSEHGLEPSHLGRFLEVRKAPFKLELTDIATDLALMNWLTEERIDWIAKTFLIRREWIDGEDESIHEQFAFDKNPQHFFTTVSQHSDALIWDEVPDQCVAYFLRWGIGKEWMRRGEGRVFVVLAIPLARLSNERTIYKYISDFQPYPWANYARTNIQLRAWARLLTISKGFICFGREVSVDVGQKIWSNDVFLRDIIENHCEHTRDDWHPEDHALYPEESVVAKDVDTLPSVIDYLKANNLPWEMTRLCGTRGKSK
jgi:hypothetical protein